MQNEPSQSHTSPLERRVDMSVPVSDIDKAVDDRLKNLARTVKMSGFRPGKVPFRLVAQQYGPQVRTEAIGAAVQKEFGDAVRQNNFRVAGYPRIEPRQAAAESALEFSAVFEVYPEFELTDLGSRQLSRPIVSIGETELDQTIDALRKQRGTFMEVTREAQAGDRVVVDFQGRLDGVVFKGGEATDYPIVLGGGSMLADFEQHLVSARAGENRKFDLTFPADYGAQDLAGKTAQFEVSIKRVEALELPPVDESFAHALGIKDGDLVHMREEIRTNVQREVQKRIRARVKEQVMNLLLEANPIEVPRALVSEESEHMAEHAKRDLAARGIEAGGLKVEASWFSEQALRRVRLGLILAEAVRANDLGAKPEKVRAMIDEIAQSYEEPAEVVRWYYSDKQQLAQVEALAIEENVVEWVLGKTNVLDVPTSFDEIMGSGA